MIRRRMRVPLVLACFSATDRPRGGIAPVARAVPRLRGRRRQQAGALGQDRRLHEAGARRIPTACASASSARRATAIRSSRSKSARADTLKNLDRYKQLERKLYFQGGAPTDAERDEIFRQGKLVLLITCTIHATEIGASQMSLELVHRLATDDSPQVKKILDNVIFVLVPSLNPDGQIMVTDWFNKNVGTPYAEQPDPVPYHPYVGHDNNRDMYMFTQKESQHTAQLLWHDWFPVGLARRASAWAATARASS